MHDKPIEIYMEKQKKEQAFSECKKQCSLILNVFGRNITVLLKKKVILSGLNVSQLLVILNYQLLYMKYTRKYLISLPTDDDKVLIFPKGSFLK